MTTENRSDARKASRARSKVRRRTIGAEGGILAALQPTQVLIPPNGSGKSFSDAGGESTPSPRCKSRSANRTSSKKTPPPASVVVSSRLAPSSVFSPVRDEEEEVSNDMCSDVSSLSSIPSRKRKSHKKKEWSRSTKLMSPLACDSTTNNVSMEDDKEEEDDDSLKPMPLFQDEYSCSYRADDEELSDEKDDVSDDESTEDEESFTEADFVTSPIVDRSEANDDEYEESSSDTDDELEVDDDSELSEKGVYRRDNRKKEDDSTDTENDNASTLSKHDASESSPKQKYIEEEDILDSKELPDHVRSETVDDIECTHVGVEEMTLEDAPNVIDIPELKHTSVTRADHGGSTGSSDDDDDSTVTEPESVILTDEEGRTEDDVMVTIAEVLADTHIDSDRNNKECMEISINVSSNQIVEGVQRVSEQGTTNVDDVEIQPNVSEACSAGDDDVNVAKGKPESNAATIHISKPRRIKREGSVPKGKWALGSKIGVGSFGLVHMGMNQRTGTLMAVKSVQLEKAVMKDIRREIDLLRSLKHVNIVRYFGAEMNETYLHIFQEWVPGGSVTSLLHKFGPFSMPVLRSYLLQVIAGLSYLHDNMILHRDIKGGNILVNDAGIVKLVDFGSSKRLAAKQHNDMESLTMRGTPYFMAPEVFEEKYGAKADVWSVGCVTYQMATARPPWKKMGFSNPMSLFAHLKETEGPPPLEMSKKKNAPVYKKQDILLLESFLKKCFFRDPSLRPSAKELSRTTFFTEVFPSEDDQTTNSRGLFSPGADSMSTWEPMKSPPIALGSATKPPLTPLDGREQQSKLASPPLLQFTLKYGPLSTDAVSPLVEPLSSSNVIDSTDWPTWAKQKYEDEQESKRKVDKDALQHSLAISEDSTAISKNPFAASHTSAGSLSPLDGLEFVDNKSMDP